MVLPQKKIKIIVDEHLLYVRFMKLVHNLLFNTKLPALSL